MLPLSAEDPRTIGEFRLHARLGAGGMGRVYLGCDDGYLYAIDTTTPAVRWRFRTGGQVRSQILVAGGLVIFGSHDHQIYALRA